MKSKIKIMIAVILAGLFLSMTLSAESPDRAETLPWIRPQSAFIQLNPELAGQDEAYWDRLFEKIGGLGMKEVIVQYLADGEAVYFPREDDSRRIFPVLDSIFDAAEDRGINLIIGLEHDPDYWVEITAPPKVLRDYFLVRADRNLRLQKDILNRYGDREIWQGYYIPDEIDDLSWRAPERRKILERYFDILTNRLRKADSGRPIAASAFFRSRTEPNLFAEILFELTRKYFDMVLLQDGQGGGNPAPEFLPLYYRAIRERFSPGERPRISAVVEIFEESGTPGGDFSAIPADPAKVLRQIEIAGRYFPDIFIFSFAAYLDPARGEGSGKLYNRLLPVTTE